MVPLQLVSDVLGLAVIGLVALVGLAFFAAILYTEHRKEMKLVETGEYAEAQESGTWMLAAGLLLLALGLADLLRAVWTGTVPEDGLTLTLLGIAALVYVAFRRREARQAGVDGDTGRSPDVDADADVDASSETAPRD
jgi:predicted transporter